MNELLITQISNIAEQELKIEGQWLDYVPDSTQINDPFFYKDKLNVLWYCQRHYAYKHYYVDADIKKTKQACYMCGRLVEVATTKYDANTIDNTLPHFALTLLSDNLNLINRCANLTHSNFVMLVNKGWASAYTYTIQTILKEDWAEYERVIGIMKAKCAKKYKWELDIAFFEALVVKNKQLCESILQEFVSPKGHEKRNKSETIYKEFISYPATTYAKLAWLKGVEVEVDTHLIPQSLLPIKPNNVYIDEYNFLKDLP